MPATVKKLGKKWRVVEKSGRPVRNKAGTAVDGGGHSTRAKALSQARAINANQRKG